MTNPMIAKKIAALINSMIFGGRTNIVFSLSDLSSLLGFPTKRRHRQPKCTSKDVQCQEVFGITEGFGTKVLGRFSEKMA